LVVAWFCLAANACVMTADPELWKDRGPVDLPSDTVRDVVDGSDVDLNPVDTGPGGDLNPVDTGPGGDLNPVDTGPGGDLNPVDTKPKTDVSCGKLDLTVATTTDDGNIWDVLYVDGESGFGWAGWWTPKAVWSYFRFALPKALPAGTTITVAALWLYGIDQDTWSASSALQIYFEDSGDAATVTNVTDVPMQPSGRPVTSPVRWPASGGLAWLLAQYNTSPNLATALEALLTAKGGLASGSHIQIWVKGAQTVDGVVATPDHSASGYSAHPAILSINYCQ
jgi:hypothetical protein